MRLLLIASCLVASLIAADNSLLTPQTPMFPTTQGINNTIPTFTPPAIDAKTPALTPKQSVESMGLVDPTITPQTVLNASAKAPKAPIQKQILSIENDGKSAVINASGLQRGISGVVWRQLDDTHRILIARVYISGIKGENARVNFALLEDVAQDALPKLLNNPKVGDNVVFYMLEDRGFIIASTQTDYQNAIFALAPELKLIHPDLFASFLTTARSAEPNANQFRAFCSNIQATNVYFALSDGIYKTDCYTLVVLDKTPFSETNATAQKPFYNRIGEIPTGYFGMFKQDIGDYEKYYRALIGLTK